MTPASHAASRIVSAALALCAGAALLAGCSAAAPTKPPADAGDAGEKSVKPSASASARVRIEDIDACTLLTQEEAQTAIATTLQTGVPVANSDTTTCTYAGDPNGPTAQVEVFAGDGAKKQLEIDRDTLGHPFTQPTGIGDEAWAEDYIIWARKGSTWASVRLTSLDDPAMFAQPLQTAMTTVLSRLG